MSAPSPSRFGNHRAQGARRGAETTALKALAHLPICRHVELLDRELTAGENDVRALLRTSLTQRGAIGSGRITFRDVASGAPERFLVAAMSMLDAESDLASRRKLFARVVECPEFLVELTRPDRLTRQQLLDACRIFITLDELLDVRLTRLASGPGGSPGAVGADAMVRVLDVLNEISAGPRLLLVLSPLTRHSDPRIASKAVMLMARRVRNVQWVERHLDSGDSRLRASVVEGLWGIHTTEARRTLWASLDDADNRVVGNALVGLNLLDEPEAGELVKAMLQDQRPHFRRTAAWVMEKIGREEFVEPLRRSFTDSNQGVRQAARRALMAIRQAAIARQLEAEALARKHEEAQEAAWRAIQAAAAAERALQSAGAAGAGEGEGPEEEAAATGKDEPAPGPREEAVPEFDIRLDGSYLAGGVPARSKRRLWPF
jgi:hypothetical protein